MSENIFQSKYLKKSFNLNEIYLNKETSPSSESSSDSEADLDSNALIIMDTKPDNNITFRPKLREKKPIFGSKLDSELRLKPYLSSDKTTEESMKSLNEMSIKTMNEELTAKCVIKPGFEQKYLIPSFRTSRRQKKKLKREERDLSLGNKWFDMRVNEMTDEKKNDLMALSMRRGWDPKRFYKKNDCKHLPKFFQIGTIVESKADFYHSRVPKKERKRTLVEELLADAEFKKFSKKKYTEALAKNPYYLKMKRKKEREGMKKKGFDFKERRKEKKNRKKKSKEESIE